MAEQFFPNWSKFLQVKGKDGREKLLTHNSSPAHPRITQDRSFPSDQRHHREKHFFWYHQPSLQVLKSGTHDKHGDQKILLGDLSMREDVVQHSVHITLVLLPEGEHAFVIVTYKQQKELVTTQVCTFTFTCYLEN